MKLHHIRNATFLIESNENFILIDPMLSKKGELPPFSFIKHRISKNPTVELPENSEYLLQKVTHCVITHSRTFGIKALQHTDHLDARGEKFLTSRNIPIVTVKKDASYLQKYGLKVVDGIDYWQTKPFLNGYITAIPAKHGHGWIRKIMANGAGYFINLEGEPTIYICGDTVLTEDVLKAIEKFQPDIVVVASGNASLDIGQPLLMSLDEVIKIVKISSGKVIANHMDALNHCDITRNDLKQRLAVEGLNEKVYVPLDGQIMEFTVDINDYDK